MQITEEQRKSDADERELLRPYDDVLNEQFQRGPDKFLLFRVTVDPCAMTEWLLVRGTSPGQPIEGMIRFVRDQLFPVVPEKYFQEWIALLEERRSPADVFWSFVACIFLEDAVKAMVRATWPYSQRSFDCVMDYYECRFQELLESPFDPQNARKIKGGLWRLIRRDIVMMNMKQILLQGRLKPVLVPLSRNAHRQRKQELRQQQAETTDAVPSGRTTNLPSPDM